MSNEFMSLLPLKPCPFCGKKPELRCLSTGKGAAGIGNYEFYRQYKLWCQNCGCVTSQNVMVFFDYSPHKGVLVDDSSLEKAIAAWNRRAGESNDCG